MAKESPIKDESNLNTNNGNLIFYDLETTGLSNSTCQILQIGAIRLFDCSIFCEYLKPLDEYIPQAASKVHGNFSTRHKKVYSSIDAFLIGFLISAGLYYNQTTSQLYNSDGKILRCKTVREVFESFIQFLSECAPVILCGHNSSSFDDVILQRYMIKLNLYHQFQSLITGYADTLKIMRERMNLTQYNMNFLKKHFDSTNVLAKLKNIPNGCRLQGYVEMANNHEYFGGKAHHAVMDCLHLICILHINNLLHKDLFMRYI